MNQREILIPGISSAEIGHKSSCQIFASSLCALSPPLKGCPPLCSVFPVIPERFCLLLAASGVSRHLLTRCGGGGVQCTVWGVYCSAVQCTGVCVISMCFINGEAQYKFRKFGKFHFFTSPC